MTMDSLPSALAESVILAMACLIRRDTMAVRPIEQGFPRFQYLEDIAIPGDFELDDKLGSLITPVVFGFPVPSDKFFRMHRLNIQSVHSAMAPPDTFFGIPALTNGLLLQVVDDNAVVRDDFGTSIRPIRRHYDFGALAGVQVDPETVANRSAVSVEWRLSESGTPFLLEPSWEFRVIIRDDITELDSLLAMVHGVLTP